MEEMNHIVVRCRTCVRVSRDQGVYPEASDVLIGIVYEKDGRYRKHYIQSDPDNVAKFIYSSDKEKMITTANDWAIMNTICGTNLDLSCADSRYTDAVLKHLIKYQQSEQYQIFKTIRE